MNQLSKIGPTADEKNSWKVNASEYNYRYHVFSKDEQMDAKPRSAVRMDDNRDTFITPGATIDKKSSYMYDYKTKPLNRTQHFKRSSDPSTIAAKPGSKMECTSSYKSCFNKKNALPAELIKPPPPQGLGWSNNDMKFSSVSRRNYRPYTASEVQASKRNPIIILPEYGSVDTNPDTRPEMNFQTTVKHNFVKHNGTFRPPPAPGAMKTPAHGIAGIAGADINAKMDLTTTHRDVFNTKRAASSCDLVATPAVAPLLKDKSSKTPKWYNHASQGEDSDAMGMSTQMNDYIQHRDVTRPRSFKPLLKYNTPSTMFHTNTLYKKAFTVHGNHRREPMVPKKRTKDDEIIKHVVESDATYDTEYARIFKEAPNSFDRPRPIVPKTTNRTSGKFYDGTSYSQNYNCLESRSIARMPSFQPKKMSNPWYKQDTEGDFTSTTRDHYKGSFAKPASICRPKTKQEGNLSAVEREVHFDTEYSNCFKPVQVVA